MLCVKEELECLGVSCGDCENPIEFLWVKIKIVVSKRDHRVGTCYWPPNQEDKDKKKQYSNFTTTKHTGL